MGDVCTQANTLGLKGKDVSVTVTKVGDEEETMKTKEYRVQLICIDDNKRYTVNAIGIDNISDEIPKVKTSHLPELLGLQKTVSEAERDTLISSLTLTRRTCMPAKRMK